MIFSNLHSVRVSSVAQWISAKGDDGDADVAARLQVGAERLDAEKAIESVRRQLLETCPQA